MALTRAGRHVLNRMVQTEMFAKLATADPTACGKSGAPWDGMSPRELLTRDREGISLGHEGASLTPEDARIEEQCRRHQHGW